MPDLTPEPLSDAWFAGLSGDPELIAWLREVAAAALEWAIEQKAGMDGPLWDLVDPDTLQAKAEAIRRGDA